VWSIIVINREKMGMNRRNFFRFAGVAGAGALSKGLISVSEMAKKVGGHGGMDFIMDWRLIDCLRNGIPLNQDVYDAALWSAFTPLSEWPVANRSNSIDVPDFTNGAWKTNEPADIALTRRGTTQVIS
jgi:hypothetical protein